MVYTITYIGEKIQEPILNSEISNGNSNNLRIAYLITGVILIFGALAAFFIFYFNTYIYLKKGDEYQRIGRKRIKWSNPVVDLSKMNVLGKEVAVNVKKGTAEKLFGRHIETIAKGGFSVKCLVDRQNCDFWYVINIPNKTDEEVKYEEE